MNKTFLTKEEASLLSKMIQNLSRVEIQLAEAAEATEEEIDLIWEKLKKMAVGE